MELLSYRNCINLALLDAAKQFSNWWYQFTFSLAVRVPVPLSSSTLDIGSHFDCSDRCLLISHCNLSLHSWWLSFGNLLLVSWMSYIRKLCWNTVPMLSCVYFLLFLILFCTLDTGWLCVYIYFFNVFLYCQCFSCLVSDIIYSKVIKIC